MTALTFGPRSLRFKLMVLWIKIELPESLKTLNGDAVNSSSLVITNFDLVITSEKTKMRKLDNSNQ